MLVTGLALSNPGPEEFEAFAAEQLVDVLETEVCRGEVLPALVRMALSDCPQLVQTQRRAIGAFVGDHTRRLDLGVLSLYRSEIGGDTVLGWPVPRFHATVLAGAEQFLILKAGLRDAGRESQ